jgi:hypothetical protein
MVLPVIAHQLKDPRHNGNSAQHQSYSKARGRKGQHRIDIKQMHFRQDGLRGLQLAGSFRSDTKRRDLQERPALKKVNRG